jgi:hypothetical protein
VSGAAGEATAELLEAQPGSRHVEACLRKRVESEAIKRMSSMGDIVGCGLTHQGAVLPSHVWTWDPKTPS